MSGSAAIPVERPSVAAITSGYSCAEPIAQETGRGALHLVGVLGGGGDVKQT